MQYLKYIAYVIKHKHYVMLECIKLGIPLRGILHDLHKFLPSELIPYAKYYYGKERNEKLDEQMDIAWLKHQNRGKHHWQYWCLIEEDTNTIKAMPMPDKYRKEMLADWIGAGKASKSGLTTKEWYYANRDYMTLHPATKYWIEQQLVHY